MTALVLVQHGDKERTAGDPGLTQEGWEQARRTAVALAEVGRPCAVYASPMKRAAETGSVIAAHFDLAVQYDDRLRERINWHGDHGQSMASFLADWERTTRDRDFVPASGDSSRRAAERMLEAMREVADHHPAGVAVVVTHGGVTVDLLRTLLGDETLVAKAPSLLADGVPCCALTTLRHAGTAWQVERIASDVHLRDA